MQSEEQAHNVSAEGGCDRRACSPTTWPMSFRPDQHPYPTTGRLTTREVARRRRQRLLELLQQPTEAASEPVSSVVVPAPACIQRAQLRATPTGAPVSALTARRAEGIKR